MRPEMALAVAALLILFSGCALPGQEPSVESQPQPVPQPAPVPPQAPEINVSIGNGSVAGEANVTANGTLPSEGGTEAEILPEVPRNVSGSITDGEFAIRKNYATPLKVYVISDGQADAVLVNKGEFNMLVDAGSFAQVDAFLKKMGIKRLNVVVATRDYGGAIGGIPSLLDSYRVDELWDNGAAQKGTAYYSLLEKAGEKKVLLKGPEALESMEVNGLNVTVLNPQLQRSLSNPDNDAIVLKLSAGSFCMLLLNPTVQERENVLISTGEPLRCDVITYYKHGDGRPEPSLLISNYAKPKDAIISVGMNNSVGLPSNTTLTRLALQSVKVWRTDQNGTVLVEAKSDGSGYTVSGNN